MEDNCIVKELTIVAHKDISVAKISYSEEGIMIVELLDDIIIGIPEIKELAQGSKELSGGEVPLLSLVVTGQRNNISTEAFAFNIFEELQIKQKTIAEALVIKNLPTRIMANFYYKVVPRPYPVKVFQEKELAIEWLLKNKGKTEL
ncbi:MAG: hypothetical protein Q8M29_01590 [Bacteroidota bacterium]|nr:hypothetical protein [Bacteroidota bacterium]